MKKRVLYLALATTLILSSCSSSNTIDESASDNSASEAGSSEENQEVSTTETSSSSEASTEMNAAEVLSYSGFQEAYIDIISYEQERLESLANDSSYDKYSATIDCYWLYDMDKDGVPELIIRYGHDESSFYGKVYTFADGKAQLINELPMGHSSLYGIPDENGLLRHWAHMGCAEYSMWTLNGEELSYESLFDEDINEKLAADEDAWYTPADEIVEGAYHLNSFAYDNTAPIEYYDYVVDYITGQKKAGSSDYFFPNDDPDFFTKVMENDETVVAIALDEYSHTLWDVPFSTLLEDDMIRDYANDLSEAFDITYADVDSDGIYECIFYLTDGYTGQELRRDCRVILSLQGDSVYAYLGSYPSETRITEDGYFVTEPNEYNYEEYVQRVFLNMENCFIYSVPFEE